ncbi:bifunctional phosphatase PAP2/diacylglycerol kinase family protein [Microbacterium azadirachtae]|uniref:bifunctional phosphatase PAP2/diacylglycerol kinase family protein n=1 Tax=Microbacterium azadirachtae TaxID=582680 RepID=UPI00088ADCDB|nr:bifunctional phosphatase PAP2/diacylglycerol kinase family protein [Microbacterium azadirachtae]SDM25950.1 undecaprenyl-diphosphatase [Microbacterium azadirachtae]SEG49549.1 undecaprenyl-diphosphatase [Microbacterium azadirachtae]SEG50462.1 undecaprenyl-diphosphatase [Microbacterium azadirachtae]
MARRKTTRPVRGAAAEVREQVHALDAAVFSAVATTPSPILDRWMPRLTNAADHSVLWLAIAGGLYLTGRSRARRAGLRGVVTLGATSLIANQLAKRLHHRERPIRSLVPIGRLSRRTPISSSFPSGHSASAAAFAAGVTAELPAAGVPLQVLAGLVGFSRVATGAHYPSDVAAGLVLGSTVAAIGRRLVPPVPPPSVPAPRELDQLPPRPRGEGVTLVVNPASHSGRGAALTRTLRRALPAMRVVELRGSDDVEAVMRRAAAAAEVLAVAGGDGTVATAAQAAIERDLPLAVFPGGTFNHFARTIGADSARHTVQAIRRGTATKVDVAYLNDRIFLNTASVGAYTDFVRIREGLEKRIGKPLAALVAGWRTMRKDRAVSVTVDGTTRESSLLFIGNGQYEPHGFAPNVREDLQDGLIDVRILDVSDRWSRFVVLLATLTGQLARVKQYHEVSAPEFELGLPGGPERIARDGEVGEEGDVLRVRAVRRALTVYRPRRG